MRFLLRNIPSFFSKKVDKPLGRWQTETCGVRMNHKIDLSNEDHCGPCGPYALEKIKVESTNKKEKTKNK